MFSLEETFAGRGRKVSVGDATKSENDMLPTLVSSRANEEWNAKEDEIIQTRREHQGTDASGEDHTRVHTEREVNLSTVGW